MSRRRFRTAIVRSQECESILKNAFNPSHTFAVRPQYTSLFKFFNILVKFFKFLTYLWQALSGEGVQNSQLCQKIILKACAKVRFTTRELLTNYPRGYSYETACIEQKNWINILYTVVCKGASVGITQRVAMSRKLPIVYS